MEVFLFTCSIFFCSSSRCGSDTSQADIMPLWSLSRIIWHYLGRLCCVQDGLDQLHNLVVSSSDSKEASSAGSGRSKSSKADLLRKCEYHDMGGLGRLIYLIFLQFHHRGMNFLFSKLTLVSELPFFCADFWVRCGNFFCWNFLAQVFGNIRYVKAYWCLWSSETIAFSDCNSGTPNPGIWPFLPILNLGIVGIPILAFRDCRNCWNSTLFFKCYMIKRKFLWSHKNYS